MKNLYTKNEFLNNRENELIKEGVFQFISNMFNKAKAYINKVKGGNEIDKIYNKYLGIIQSEFSKKAQVNLNILAANKVKKQEKQAKQTLAPEQKEQSGQQQAPAPEQKQQTNQQQAPAPEQKQQTGQQQVSAKTESVLNEEIAETQAPDVKMNVKTLKEKQQTITKILNFYQDKALKEMDAILKKLGGAEKNKDLAIYIDSKKDEFRLAFLSAEIEAYNQGGDKIAANKLATERTNLTKQINNKLKNLGQKQQTPAPEQKQQTNQQAPAPEQKQQAPAPEQKQQTNQQAPAPEQPKQSRYDKLTDEQKTKYQELKKAWIEKQKQEGKNPNPGQGTRDGWYKQVGEVK